uniref:Uncharacterized protein n=1 Tax=Nelumbo nucifera TaxID=4432 RepID=A0A822XMQ0_NELNU|nr:TPA_asm: hypothetical protein HUJ06_023113 [Nelumbo nucifera]
MTEMSVKKDNCKDFLVHLTIYKQPKMSMVYQSKNKMNQQILK